MASQQLSDETMQYLQDKKVPQLMEHLYHEMLVALPEDQLAHLHQLLQNKTRPQIVIAGPPAGGKGTQCELMAIKYGVVHISTGDLLREETRSGSDIGKEAETYMNKGAMVPDALITKLLQAKLATEEVKTKGWLLDGFPRTRSQALSLQIAGVLPSVLLMLDVADEVVMSRIAGRRSDPLTGQVYHIEFNPPPADVEVVQRPDDSPEAIAMRLKHYHANMADVRQCYQHIAVNIDGDRSKEDIFAEICEQVETRVVTV
jgi:adenylate kinase